MKIRFIKLLICTVVFVAPVFADDPIDNLVNNLNSWNRIEAWNSGSSAILGLPYDAATNAVIDKAVQMTGFDEGQIKSYQVIEVRQVEIKHEKYFAALLNSDLGQKVLLFRYEYEHWWHRFYNIPNKSPNQGMDPTESGS